MAISLLTIKNKQRISKYAIVIKKSVYYLQINDEKYFQFTTKFKVRAYDKKFCSAFSRMHCKVCNILGNSVPLSRYLTFYMKITQSDQSHCMTVHKIAYFVAYNNRK